MAIVLKPKKSETASSVPTTSDLAVGEICMNIADRKIYTRKSDDSIVVVGSHVDATVGGDLSGTVSNAQIAANAVTSTEIAANAVTSTEIASNSVGIAELNVADGSNLQVLTTNGSGTLSWTSKTDATVGANTIGITELDVSDGTNGQALTTNGSGTLSFTTISAGDPSMGGDLSGTASNAQIVANAITATEIASNAVTTVKILNANVTGAKIATNAVDGTHIALGSDASGDIMYYNGTNYVRLAKGTNGEVLTLASGVPSWAADSTNVTGTSVGGDLSGTVGNAQIVANAVGIAELNVSDGSADQVLKTNGSGTLSFTTITPGVSEAVATSKAVTMAIALG